MMDNNIEYTINDFIKTSRFSWDTYILNNDCIILNKQIIKNTLELDLYEKNDLSKYLDRFNIYIKWLSSDCKEELIKKYVEIIDSLTENINITIEYILEIGWYEELIILRTIIGLSEEEPLGASIFCYDNKNNKFLEIDFKGKNIEIVFNKMYNYNIEKNLELKKIGKECLSLEKKYHPKLKKCKRTANGIMCRIHNCLLSRKKIEIAHGFFPAPMAGYTEDREILFPNCDDFLIGGCDIDDGPMYKNRYVCKECNKKREEWKGSHQSEIYIRMNMNIKDNIIIVLNNDIKILMEKNYRRNGYWEKNISIQNGKYIITAKNKKTDEVIARIETELYNENLTLNIENENNNILFKIVDKSKFISDHLWY
jgi:hypothetical protein